MSKAKSFVGWICLLSLVLSVSLFVASVYIMAQPFWSGAKVYRLPAPDVLGIAKPLGERGLDSTDNAILERYVNQQAEPTEVHRGWGAAFMAMSNPDMVEIEGFRNVAAAAVLDPQGRVMSAYPVDLIGKVFPFGEPIENIQNSQQADENHRYYSTASARYPYWTSSFVREVSQYVSNTGPVYFTKILDRSGNAMAVLAVVQTHDGYVTSLPWHLDRNKIIELRYAGLIALIVYLILLPLWVGMDAHWRGMRPFAWGSLVAMTNAIGLGAYLVARLPAPYPCMNCGEEVMGKYVRCPACGVSLMNRCPICRTPMKPNWQYCPACNVTPGQVLETTAPTGTGEPLATRLMEITRSSLCVTVLDSGTGDAMPNARVAVTGRASRVDGMTNAEGVFEARKLRSGKYTITVTRAGYEPAEAELDISEAPESVQLKLRAMPSRIIGRVVERGTMRPVAGVRVYIDSSRLERSTLTGAEGGFVLEDIPAGPFTVAVDAVGFKAQTRLAEVGPGQQVTLDFSIEPADTVV